VKLLARRLLVALDASGVAGALVSRLPGRARVSALARVALPPGALVPSAVDDNLAGPEVVRAALRTLLSTLGAEGRPARLLLPGGLARLALFERSAGVSAVELARFRLSQALPYPASEALVDGLRVGARGYAAAAVRRRVVEGYEVAARDAGLAIERVELAPLAALAALQRSAPRGSSVDLILGDGALTVAARRDGALALLRSRLRDPGPGEPERLRDEADRSARLAGDGTAPTLRVVGPGSTGLVRALSFAGRHAVAGWRIPLPEGATEESSELAWLGAAL
jgi:hypothetical protein